MRRTTCGKDHPAAGRLEQEQAPGAAQELVDKLETHVQCWLGGRVRDFRVLSKKGGLLLQGQSQTYHAKQLAQQRVMEMTALPIVANEIVVE
jgi:osmotically-inducible protein OsmY